MQTNHGNYPKKSIYLSKTINCVIIPVLLLKLLAVEHTHPTENATLLNTVIISLIPNSTIVYFQNTVKFDNNLIIKMYYDLSLHSLLIFILF